MASSSFQLHLSLAFSAVLLGYAIGIVPQWRWCLVSLGVLFVCQQIKHSDGINTLCNEYFLSHDFHFAANRQMTPP